MTLLELLYAMCFTLVVSSSISAAKAAHSHVGGYILCSGAGALLGACWVVAIYKGVEWVIPKLSNKAGVRLWMETAFVLLLIAVWIVLGGFAGAFSGEAMVHALV